MNFIFCQNDSNKWENPFVAIVQCCNGNLKLIFHFHLKTQKNYKNFDRPFHLFDPFQHNKIPVKCVKQVPDKHLTLIQ